jgi:putative hydroxymethylpyrimidine transport system substrate-binding protein
MPGSRRRRARGRVLTPSVAVVALAVLAAACGGAGAGGGSRSAAPLSVELDWVPNPDHVGLYYAQDEGYFADHGLSVTFHPPSNAADPIKLVGLGKVDLAITYEPEMFYGQQNGLPVMAVATVVPVPLNALIVPADQHVTRLSQLAGRSVGVTGIPSDDAFFRTMLRTAGLTSDQVQEVTVGFNLLPSLLGGKVDAILGGYRNVEAIQVAQETGADPTVFTTDQLGVPAYAELVVVADEERLQGDTVYADSVQRFIAALIEGTNGAVAHPAAATSIMTHVTQYDAAFLRRSVPYTLKLLTPASGSRTACIDRGSWQRYGDWMFSSGLLTSSPNASSITTDAYMPYACPS